MTGGFSGSNSESRAPTAGDVSGAASLRSDLEVIGDLDPSSRFRVIACNISGKFTRVSAAAWQALKQGKGDTELQNSAARAGWTRHRQSRVPKRFSWLAIQVPLFGIDPIACWMRDRTGWLFSWTAVKLWSFVFITAWVMVLSRWDQLTSDLAILPSYLSVAHPFVLFAVFLFTKLAHELGHATMCRRAGARCGKIGIYFFCGFPCPYCDVTQVWRQPSSTRRMAVMSAGIYVEWVIASVGVFLWCWSDVLAIRLTALNVILLCGVSTFLFNANPLMRYDGYYVLADWLGSVDLRSEARRTFAKQLVSCLESPAAFFRAAFPDRKLLLVVYSVASLIYRGFVMIAIAGILLWATHQLGFQIAGRVMVGAMVMASVLSIRFRITRFLRGDAPWQDLTASKRWILFLLGAFLITLLVVAPMPRFRTASGRLDAADFSVVYLPSNSRLISTNVDYGASVEEGQVIASSEDVSLQHRRLQVETRHQLASMQTDLAKRQTLLERAGDRDWLTYESAERAALDSKRDLDKQLARLEIVSPRAGIVIPPTPILRTKSTSSVGAASSRNNSSISRDGTGVRTLTDSVGNAFPQGSAWVPGKPFLFRPTWQGRPSPPVYRHRRRVRGL